MSEQRLEASSRVALAAYLHDLGKFAERARLDVSKDDLDYHKQEYCPRRPTENGGYFNTHIHAAYTALAFNLIEQDLPALRGEEFFPFGSSLSPQITDSLVNAAAHHHAPETFLQWIIATADRAASGFEREAFERYNESEDITDTGLNHYQARQLSLFESIRLDGSTPKSLAELTYRQPLQPFSPAALFPKARTETETSDNKKAQAEYRKLWDEFLLELDKIPNSHRERLSLWLDHFDSAWQTFTHAIPSATVRGTRPDVSLYDHSRTTSALATALWRYHADNESDTDMAAKAMRKRSDWDEEKFLLIQGDFFGVQSFIFATGTDTRKRAAKLLRGRSLYVSLITECAALHVLEALDLPPTSQVTNAAGKFLIVAPNTPEVHQKLAQVQAFFDDWFLQESYGQSGLGLAWLPASCNDFISSGDNNAFQALMKKLFDALEHKKYQAFSLCDAQSPAPVFENYLNQVAQSGQVCSITGWGPATTDSDDLPVCKLAADQIKLGTFIAGKARRLIISRQRLSGSGALSLPLFGYQLYLTDDEEASGRFGPEVRTGNIRRLFDFSLPRTADAPLWNGYARRSINGYVPTFSQADIYAEGRYGKHEERSHPEVDQIKEFGHLACEDRQPLNTEPGWRGVEGLGILKGDVDDLGALFQKGLERPTFAKMASLSRQLNAFFSTYLPWLCQSEFPNTYTVFAGGDDFFLIGPWHSIMALSVRLRQAFARFVAGNPDITFSCGIAVSKPGIPVPALAEMGENALEHAKAYTEGEHSKNAVHCFGQTVSWADFISLAHASSQLDELSRHTNLSTGFIYGMLSLTELAADTQRPESALWRSRLHYRSYRQLESEKDETRRRALCDEVVKTIGEEGIRKYGRGYQIALTTHLYLNRD
ncbi:MAG: type III-A CRISPR-associated protein Cas10/Csm1 [Oceanospirillaceae bacterium]|nr:type III-A CRISPR-associated protein Cas10/Csm1 [Oceanospirillaceae bacterium]